MFSLAVHEFKEMAKEIVDRRRGEPIEFLRLPRVGLLGSQASTTFILFFFYIVASPLKS